MSDVTVGATVRLRSLFYVDGVLTDPDTIGLSVRSPDGTTTTPVPQHPGDGTYYHDLTLDQSGLWSYRFTGTGAAAGISEGTVNALPSMVATGLPAYTYDLTTGVGKVRLYTDDHDFSAIDPTLPAEMRSALFTDAELSVFLASQSESPEKAAAMALRAMAANKSLLVRVRRMGDTTVDYGSLRDDLLKLAASYEKVADTAAGGALAPADGYAEVGWDDFSMRRIVTNSVLRRGE